MLLFRSIAFFSFNTLWTIFIVTLLSPLALLRNQRILINMAYIWSHIVIKSLDLICNVRIEVIGEKNIPKEPFIIACKHQSAIETIFLMIYINFPVFIIKKQLLKIPFYGWFLAMMGMIAIDRTKGSKTLKNLLVQCKTVFANKRNLIIFPEGTRTIPLEEKKFKSGIALIKKHFQHIPLIPVALNSGLFWPKDSWVIKPGIMKLQILPEIKYTNKVVHRPSEIETGNFSSINDITLWSL